MPGAPTPQPPPIARRQLRRKVQRTLDSPIGEPDAPISASVSYGGGDGVTDERGGRPRKPRGLLPVVAFDCPYQAAVAGLQQRLLGEALVTIVVGDGHHQPEVALDEPLAGRLAPGLKELGRGRLLAGQAPTLEKVARLGASLDGFAELAHLLFAKGRQAVHRLEIGAELLVLVRTAV